MAESLIFLHGSLRHKPLLHAVAGAALRSKQAALPGFAVWTVADNGAPILLRGQGGPAAGIAVAVTPEVLDRIDFYAACFGMARAAVSIVVAGKAQDAFAYPAGAEADAIAPFSLAAWARKDGDLVTLIAEEVMRQRATATPAEVAARLWMIAARAQSFLTAQGWRRPGLAGTNPGRAAVQVIDRRHPYSRFFTVEELSIRHRRFDGSLSGVQDRAVFRVADAVTVLPYDPVRDRILLIEQVRLGAFAHGDAQPWLLEPVAGMIDAGETPEAAARRETAEEAGLALRGLHRVARYYPSPGGIAQVLTSFVGIADLPDNATGIGGHEAEGEDILSHLVPWDLACEMLAGGDMANAPLVISMQWLMLNRSSLRTQT